jgi:hypothetical protein
MNRVLQVAAVVAPLAAMALWTVWVFAVTDFNEAPALAGGGLWCVAACALGWQAKRRLFPWLIVGACGAATLAVGWQARRAAVPQQAARRADTIAALQTVAQALRDYRALRGTLPDGPWPAMAAALQSAGVWRDVAASAAPGGRPAPPDRVPLKDEWGCAYDYAKTAAGGFILKSSGPDRRWDTPDDIVVNESTASSAAAPGPGRR